MDDPATGEGDSHVWKVLNGRVKSDKSVRSVEALQKQSEELETTPKYDTMICTFYHIYA